MIIEVALEDWTSMGDNIIYLADYVDRMAAKARMGYPWEGNVIPLAGCDVINIADRRR